MGASYQTAQWPTSAPMGATEAAARDEARRAFPQRTRGFARSFGDPDRLSAAAIAALRTGRHDEFAKAVNHVRRQLDEIEALWQVALGKPS